MTGRDRGGAWIDANTRLTGDFIDLAIDDQNVAWTGDIDRARMRIDDLGWRAIRNRADRVFVLIYAFALPTVESTVNDTLKANANAIVCVCVCRLETERVCVTQTNLFSVTVVRCSRVACRPMTLVT